MRLVCAELWGGNRAADFPVESPGLAGRIFSQPSGGGRGGDVHYLSVCGSGLLSRVVIADVAGHGEPVARVSDEIHTLLRRYMDRLGGEQKLLYDLNLRLIDGGLDSMVTAAAIGYYPHSRTLSVAYAGHPPAWVYRRNTGRWSRLTVPARPAGDRRPFDLPLAITPDARFQCRRERMSVGDRLLILTDGVLETPGPDGRIFGDERVESLLARLSAEPPRTVSEALLADLRAFGRDESLRHDDVTFLLVEFVPGPAAPAFWTALRNRLLRPRGEVPTPR